MRCTELATAKGGVLRLFEYWIVLDGFGFTGSWVGLDLDVRLITGIGLDGSVSFVGLQLDTL